MELQKGDRVKLSDAAKRAGVGRSRRNNEERIGTVSSITKWITVHWDGTSQATRYSYHRDYIVPAVTKGHQGGEA